MPFIFFLSIGVNFVTSIVFFVFIYRWGEDTEKQTYLVFVNYYCNTVIACGGILSVVMTPPGCRGS